MSDKSKSASETKSRAGATPDAREKIDRPHARFDHPSEVIVDPALSKAEKTAALGAMEQDAKQLATASAEGMSGGEDTELREVLIAKDALDLPPNEVAFAAVIQFLQSALAQAKGKPAHATIADAIAALDAARVAIGEMGTPGKSGTGPAMESTDELEAELEKEKLDP